jgi:hypothetical protein
MENTNKQPQDKFIMDPQVAEQERRIAANTSTWDSFGTDAEHARIRMMDGFKTWALAKRAELERTVYTNRRHMHDVAPFAQKAMDEAATPGSVPVVVVEFAHSVLSLIEHEAQLEMLNAWFRAECECQDDTCLDTSRVPAARQLWDWYVSEQEEQAGQ